MKELQLSKDLNVITAEIQSYKQIAGQSIFEIGRRLKHVKENDLVHGEFGKWLESINMTHQHANRYMRVVEELGDTNYTSMFNLGIAALYEIATLPEEEREKEHVTSKGETKTVDEMTVRELQELKRKLKEKEAEANQYHDWYDNASKLKDEAEKQAEQARRSEEIARKRLEELEDKKPQVIEKEVVIEVDKTDYEKIRQLEKQLEKAKQERQKAIEESDRNIESLENYMNSYVKPEQERKSKIVSFTNDLSVGVSNLASNIEKAKQRLDETIASDEQVINSIERSIESLKDYIIMLDEMKGGDVIEIN